MKKFKINFLFAAVLSLFLLTGTAAYGQKIKSLVNKVSENESVKRAADAIKENETVKSTVQAVKESVVNEVNGKIENLSNPKSAPAEQVVVVLKAPAQALAPDVKNSISDVRAFAGLTKEEFDTKAKSLGFPAGVEDPTLGAIVYKAKTLGYVLAIKMGLRNNLSYVREITKTVTTKNVNLATTKTNFLKLGKQAEDLKAQFTTASVKAKNTKGTNVQALNTADKTSKLLPAFYKFSTKKEDGVVTDSYAETDYNYDLKLNQSTLKAVSTAVVTITVTDLTVSVQ